MTRDEWGWDDLGAYIERATRRNIALGEFLANYAAARRRLSRIRFGFAYYRRRYRPGVWRSWSPWERVTLLQPWVDW